MCYMVFTTEDFILVLHFSIYFIFIRLIPHQLHNTNSIIYYLKIEFYVYETICLWPKLILKHKVSSRYCKHIGQYYSILFLNRYLKKRNYTLF